MAEVFCKLYAGESPDIKCRCGAPKRIVHCPACGSTNFYSKQSAGLELPIPLADYALFAGAVIPLTDKTEVTKLRGFRCRRCDVDFYEGQNCEAPFFETESMKHRRELEEGKQRTTELYQNAIKEALARGESPDDARRSGLRVLLKMTGNLPGETPK